MDVSAGQRAQPSGDGRPGQGPAGARHSLLALALGVSLALVLGAGSFALQLLLPQPRPGDVVGADAARTLLASRKVTSVLTLMPQHTVAATCYRLKGSGDLLELPGRRVLVNRVYMLTLRRGQLPRLRQAELRRRALFAFCPRYLVALIDQRLVAQRKRHHLPLYRGRDFVDNEPAYRLELRPGLELLVSAEDYAPLGFEQRGASSFVTALVRGRPLPRPLLIHGGLRPDGHVAETVVMGSTFAR